MRTGMAWLAEQRKLHLATAIVYVRGVDEIEIPNATVVPALRASDDGGGATIEYGSRDYLIPADAIPTLLPPAIGDVIREADGSEYAVAGSPCWQWLQADHYTVRVHTRHIRRADPA